MLAELFNPIELLKSARVASEVMMGSPMDQGRPMYVRRFNLDRRHTVAHVRRAVVAEREQTRKGKERPRE